LKPKKVVKRGLNKKAVKEREKELFAAYNRGTSSRKTFR